MKGGGSLNPPKRKKLKGVYSGFSWDLRGKLKKRGGGGGAYPRRKGRFKGSPRVF